MDEQTTANPRKRPRENETEAQRIKREKAAERQRRKRERDRAQAQSQAQLEAQQQQQAEEYAQAQAQAQVQAQAQQVQQVVVNAAGIGMLYASPDQQHLLQNHPLPHQLVHPQSISMAANMNGYQEQDQAAQAQQPHLSSEEADRRDKVRAAARERQRKHRALVKERKMRDMGMEMGDDDSGDVDDTMRYQPGQYALTSDLPHSIPILEPTFTGVGQGLGGQTFASTLLLSFSCAPLLKAHLLRTLNMTNEELASLEPVIADAWDRWNSQRSVQYAEAQRTAQTSQPTPTSVTPAAFTVEAQSQQPPQPPAPTPNQQATPGQTQPQTQPPPQAQTQQQPPPTAAPNHPPPPTFAHTNGPDISSLDFRNRFSHQLTRPVPSFSPAAFPESPRTNGSNATEAIEPHLTNGASGKNS